MIFLNPAVLFGLLAASIPVLIHMLNLRKLKRIDFSTLAFLKELQKNKIRKIKFKQWLLLALRVLIILFLVMAFARPTLKGIAIGGTTSAAKTTAVFILDDTFSMSAVDVKGSYLNQAKATIQELMKQLQEGDDVALILVSGKNTDEVKTTGNLAEFEKRVDEVNISYSSGYLHNAIVKAAKVLGDSKNFNKEIYLLSDFQSGRLFEKESLSDFSQLLNDKVRLYTLNYSGKEIFNIGIDQLKIDNQIFEKDKPVNFSVTITHYSEQLVQNAVVSLFLNGERSSQQSVDIGAGESKIISMQAVPKTSGYINAIAEIEDDDILQDNKRYTTFFIPEKIPVVIFSDKQSDVKFLELALTAGDDKKSIIITNRNLNQLTSVDLNQYDVVIIAGSENASGIERLKSYLTNGGSFLLMPGENSSISKFNELTKSLSLPFPTGMFGKLNSTESNVEFDKVELNHPVFKDIFSNQDKKKIESPEIYHFVKITTEGKGINIISLTDGSSFLGEYKYGSGKIFLMNTAPVLSWSNLPLKGIFVPLLNKLIFYLAAKDNSREEVTAGETVEINSGNVVIPQIRIVRPDKAEEFISPDKKTTGNYINYSNTSVTGSYKVFSDSKIIKDFSVNTEPNESVTKYLSNKEFEDYLDKINFEGKLVQIDKDEDPAGVILQSRFGSELWKYFVIIALLLALIEMAVARNTKKELVGVQNIN